jgi:glycosyltransferase involved in cell wall biosynthesis
MESLNQYSHYKNLFREKKCCVIVPTYNNAQFLEGVLNDVLAYTDDVIVVNDGSTDNTLEVIEQFSQVELVSYPKNKGKGHALKSGFRHANASGYKYAISIDSDGQHYAKDLPTFIELIDEHPNAIIIGARDLNQENMNGKSNFANKFSNFWFKVETGISMPDTQSGYRLYPVHALNGIRFFTNKYEFEIEVLVRASWKGIDIMAAPIDVYYPEKEDRVTHFRPFKDFFRISVLNTVLVTLAFLYYLPRKLFLEYRGKSMKQIVREIVRSSIEIPNHTIAFSIAFGVFMGIFPIWGYQLLIGFFLAHLLKLNKAIFFIAANISIPPMIPFIIYLSYVTGSFLMGEGSWALDLELSLGSIKENLMQYLLGAVALSFIAGSAFGVVSYSLLTVFKKR